MPTALITGASSGLGRALSVALAAHGWNLIVDARRRAGLDELTDLLGPATSITPIAGDVADAAHRADLVEAVDSAGELQLLVNNASTLGPTPLSSLDQLDLNRFSAVLQINTVAPLQLSTVLLPHLARSGGTVINFSSDAAVEHYEGWGLYGASKSALDHLTLTLAVENPGISWYAVDPGDMRTAMAQQAFPGDDISDRPEPDGVVGSVLELLATAPPSGRYRAADLPAHQAVAQ